MPLEYNCARKVLRKKSMIQVQQVESVRPFPSRRPAPTLDIVKFRFSSKGRAMMLNRESTREIAQDKCQPALVEWR